MESPREALRVHPDALLENTGILAYSYARERSRHRKQVADARALLDEETWAKARSEGRDMSVERAVEYALDRGT